MRRSADMVFVNVPYNSCRVLRAPCIDGDCRTCSIPIVLRERAQDILHADAHGLDWEDAERT